MSAGRASHDGVNALCWPLPICYAGLHADGALSSIAYADNAGRAVAIVPKSIDPRGYMDVGRDDIDDDELLGPWQQQALKASASGYSVREDSSNQFARLKAD